MKRCSTCEETTIIPQIFETNSLLCKFLCEIVHYGESLISVFQEIFTRTHKISGGGQALGNNSMKFWDFPDISLFVWAFFCVFYMYMKCNIIKIWLIYIHTHILICKYLFNWMKWIKKKKHNTTQSLSHSPSLSRFISSWVFLLVSN